VALIEEVNAVLLRKLPPKLKDLGSFTIPCRIGDHDFEQALLDLGLESICCHTQFMRRLVWGS
jgi:hypothetical protein